jgi:hypothetical protein
MSEREKPRTCVVVSYWTGMPPKYLHRLLSQMRRIDAGAPFDLVIVCNGGLQQPLALPARFEGLRPRIINRENTGYNLGAWEDGWREAGDYEYFLFLQDDCVLKRANWVSEFEFRMSHDDGIGLLGETIMWENQSWRYLREATDRDLGRLAWSEGESVHPIDAHIARLEQRGIPRGECGTHLQSLVLFTRRSILEEIGGFPIMVPDYQGAVSSEIALSRLVESRGYRISRVRSRSFSYIGHREWKDGNQLNISVRWRLGILRKRLLHGDGVRTELKRFIREWRAGKLPGSDSSV